MIMYWYSTFLNKSQFLKLNQNNLISFWFQNKGDYFETLLYKLFVSIDDRTSLGELASLLEVDLELVLNAVSLYCRLSFAKKKTITQIDEALLDTSWNEYNKNKHKPVMKRGMSLLDHDFNESSKKTENLFDQDLESLSIDILDLAPAPTPPPSTAVNTSLTGFVPSPSCNNKRIGFLFDSTLTAFLMMGNLSSGLKNHAVTMFEVGE